MSLLQTLMSQFQNMELDLKELRDEVRQSEDARRGLKDNYEAIDERIGKLTESLAEVRGQLKGMASGTTVRVDAGTRIDGDVQGDVAGGDMEKSDG